MVKIYFPLCVGSMRFPITPTAEEERPKENYNPFKIDLLIEFHAALAGRRQLLTSGGRIKNFTAEVKLWAELRKGYQRNPIVNHMAKKIRILAITFDNVGFSIPFPFRGRGSSSIRQPNIC